MGEMAEPLISDVLIRQLDCDQPPIPGAYEFLPQRDGVIFRVKTQGPQRARNGASHVQVRLGSNHKYTVQFFKFNPQHKSIRKISMIPDVLLDQVPAAVLHGTQIPVE